MFAIRIRKVGLHYGPALSLPGFEQREVLFSHNSDSPATSARQPVQRAKRHVVKGTHHAGHITKRRTLDPAFTQGLQRRTLKINKYKVVSHVQKLCQVT